jgi:hypothetical protein
MKKFVPGLFAAVLVIGLGSVPTLAYAEEDATEGGDAASSGEGSAKEDSMMEKLEEDFKEEPTDEATSPIEDAEDPEYVDKPDSD